MELPTFRQLRTAVLFFFLFFGVTAIAQYQFLRSETEQIFVQGLRDDAADLNRAVAYDNGVDLAAFNKAIDAANFAVILNDGSILDFEFPKEGVPEDLLPPVECPLLTDTVFAGPTTVSYTTGAKHPETWTVQAKRVEGGTIILAFSELDHVDRGADRLRANIGALGSTLAQINKQGPRAIDKEIAWALINDQRRLVNGMGRIPLKTDPMEIGRRSQRTSPYQRLGDATYYVLYSPITDKAGTRVGTAILSQEVKLFDSAMANLLRFNVAIAALSFVLFLILALFSYRKHEREKQEIREAFQNYFSPQILEAILREPERLKLGGQRREVTVLFSDIRSFTAITERLAPQQLTRLLQEYFSEMAEAVFVTDGIVDKYIGDAIMAFWGAPIEQQDQADRAVRTAIDMTKRLAALQAKWAKEGLPFIDIGIGINLGIATVGNFGSAKRFDYTVIGDTVNAASRLEALNKDYKSHIIISESTKEQLTGAVEVRDLGEVQVRGKEKSIRIFEVLTGTGGPRF